MSISGKFGYLFAILLPITTALLIVFLRQNSNDNQTSNNIKTTIPPIRLSTTQPPMITPNTGATTSNTGARTLNTGSTGAAGARILNTGSTGAAGARTLNTGSTGATTSNTGSTGAATSNTGAAGAATSNTGSTGAATSNTGASIMLVPTNKPVQTTQSQLYLFSSHTFTTAGKSGPIGPTLAEVKSAYSGVSWAQNSDYLNMTTPGIQEWKVPDTGNYTIRAVGAAGGDSSDGNKGGKGIDISTTTTLNKGEIIKILVGQKGITVNSNNTNAPGGGGGTFVIRDNKTPIIVAGGGGGATSNLVLSSYSGDKNGGNGMNITSGGGGGRGHQSNMIARPGTNGEGAFTSAETIGNGNGSPGGGLLSNGVFFNTSQPVGIGFINGGKGGGDTGGFGGGAGGFTDYRFSGGGAGGYSGGAGAIYDGNTTGFPFITSGGGGSYSISTMIENGYNNDNGRVTITLI
jgi:hypothetical protein